MNEQDEQQPAGRRGEAAWKQERERIAARNDQARKEGKRRREEYERSRQDARREADARRRAQLLKKSGPR
jgi:hypothetical protein